MKQLNERNITDIYMSKIDTITDPRFYSHSASSVNGLNQKEKFGRNFAGAFFKVDLEESKAKLKKLK